MARRSQRRNQPRIPFGWIAAGLAGILVVALVAIYAIQNITSDDSTPTAVPTTVAAAGPTQTAIANLQVPDQAQFGAAPGVLPYTLENNGDVASGCWTEDQRVSGGTQPLQWSAAPTMTIDPSATYTADLVTNYGTVTIQLLPGASPTAVNNFVCLARAGYYDNSPFHRIVDNFVIQGGDPTGSGTGGPGYTIPDQENVGDYAPGMVSMARTTSPNSTGSQFFINTADNTAQLSAGGYINFARVIGGFDVVAQIATVAKTTSASGEVSSPVAPVTLQSVTIHSSSPVGAAGATPESVGTPGAATPAGESATAIAEGATPVSVIPAGGTPVGESGVGTPIATPIGG